MKHAWIPAALCGLGLTLGAAERLLIEDFSDVGTWRSNPVRNTTPGKWFGADVYLGATPDASRDDGYAGKLLFHFADASKAGQVDFLRAKAGQPEVFADGVEFDINPRGISGSLRFTLEDSQGKRFMTSPGGVFRRGVAALPRGSRQGGGRLHRPLQTLQDPFRGEGRLRQQLCPG